MRNGAIVGGLLALSLLVSISLTARSDEPLPGFHDSCMKNVIATLEKQGRKIDENVQQMSNNYCNCAQNEVKAKFTDPELQALAQPNHDPALTARMQPIMQQCAKETFHQ